jgi:hypothetical protein
VKGILADVNIEGYVDSLFRLLQTEPWSLFWSDLNLEYYHFNDVGSRSRRRILLSGKRVRSAN